MERKTGGRMSRYLELLEKGGITPNFWCSDEYFSKAHLEEKERGNFSMVIDGDWLMFPMISLTNPMSILPHKPHLVEFTGIIAGDENKIWSDFPEWNPSKALVSLDWEHKFLDYEYIYDPKAFLNMKGGAWAVFRKNCRKWPRRFGDGNLTYDWIHMYHHYGDLNELLTSWLEKKGDEKIEDDQVMMSYVFGGKFRKLLWDRKGKIYGMNIWDKNYKYINFRYCICRPEEFLSEYMRLLFYTDPIIQEKNKLVNDGGVLDNPNLKKFKDKMNPHHIREVFSWFQKDIIQKEVL
jgi:hypothetical protein